MPRRLEIYKCYVCGNVVEVVHSGKGSLFCCGRSMTVFSDRTVNADREEYYPVVERTGDIVRVAVASDVHEIARENHHVQWIEVIAGGMVCRQFLASSDPPEATFTISAEQASEVRARAYCTKQGLCIERTE